MASAWGKAWGKAWGSAWGRLFAPAQPPGALAGDRADVRTKRPPDSATARLAALPITDRPDQPASIRPEQTDSTRSTSAATQRATQTYTSARPSNQGGRRK